MPKIYVHDFMISPFEIENQAGETDFYCSVNVYYSFNEFDEEWPLEYFNVSAGTPNGFRKYLEKCRETNVLPKTYFFPHLIIMEKYNEDELCDFIKAEISKTEGKSENEIILKVLRKFDWEYGNDPDVYNQLFKP